MVENLLQCLLFWENVSMGPYIAKDNYTCLHVKRFCLLGLAFKLQEKICNKFSTKMIIHEGASACVCLLINFFFLAGHYQQLVLRGASAITWHNIIFLKLENFRSGNVAITTKNVFGRLSVLHGKYLCDWKPHGPCNIAGWWKVFRLGRGAPWGKVNSRRPGNGCESSVNKGALCKVSVINKPGDLAF